MIIGTCLLCFTDNVKILDIKDTYLQSVYEKISDDKIQNDSHCLCYICCARLKQFYSLVKQTLNQKSLGCDSNLVEHKCLLQFSIVNITAPVPHVTIKQEPNFKEGNIDIKEENLNDSNEDVVKGIPQSFDDESAIEMNNDEKPYSCHICNKKFTRSYNLKIHGMIHTGEKPHNCDICDKKFRLSHHLRSHKMIHAGDKPYSCM